MVVGKFASLFEFRRKQHSHINETSCTISKKYSQTFSLHEVIPDLC